MVRARGGTGSAIDELLRWLANAGSNPIDRNTGSRSMAKKNGAPRNTPGPKPERVRIEGAWKEAVEKALEKGKPPKGK